jgi:4-amino-4-deoxy-L-arabinose transferase-like glycosyltransferase
MSVLVCLIGAYATFRLGKKLYTAAVGHLAAILFITSQAILLGMHDVRTDALLTGLTIIAIWQLVEFIDSQRLMNILLGASSLALAVGTKGMIAVLVTGCCLFFYVLGRYAWSKLLTWKLIAGVAMFIIMLMPFLYCYYQQFDLHPEKFVNGAQGVSGIKFLLWTQSFERLAATHSQGSTNPEFIFLYHSFLWSFLPWVVIALGAWIGRTREFFRNGVKALFTKEQLTFLGTFVAFNIMSLSQFKLPHYMNLLFPMIAIGTAAFFYEQLNTSNKLWQKIFQVSQYVIIVVLFIAAVLLNAWVFPANSLIMALAIGMFTLVVISFFKSPDTIYGKLWIPSAIGILAFNVLLNTNFYPQLAKYQAGSSMAAQLDEQRIDREKTVDFPGKNNAACRSLHTARMCFLSNQRHGAHNAARNL